MSLKEIGLTQVDFKRLPASFDDPARVLLRFPGITVGNDQANGIVFHGLPAHLIMWRLNGLDVVNPNHLSNAGTLSDLASASAGGVNMMSGNVLDAFRFYDPSMIELASPAISGTADMLITADRKNYVQLSVLGLETGLHKKWRSGTHLFANYRYSFTGLLNDLGVALGNEAIRFDDLVAGLSTKTQNLKSTLLFAAGRSSNYHAALSPPFVTLKDGQNIDYKSGNITTQWLAEQTFGKQLQHQMGISFSSRSDKRESTGNIFFSDSLQYNIDDRFRHQHSRLSAMSKWHHQSGWNAEARFLYDDIDYRLSASTGNNDSLHQKLWTALVKSYRKVQIHRRWLMNLSLGLQKDREWSVLPGAELKYLAGIHTINATWNITAATGIYNDEIQPTPMRAQHYNVGYQLTGQHIRASATVFQHTIRGLSADDAQYNYLHGFDFASAIPTGNQGRGKSSGISVMADYSPRAGWWLNLNYTFFSSRYKNRETESWHHTESDYGQIGNATVGKTFNFKKGRLTFSFSNHFRGGQYFFQIQPNTHIAIKIYDSPPTQKMKDYIRWDSRINYAWKNAMISIDLQNVTSRKNDGHLRPGPDGPYIEPQLGLIPVISYKRSFN